MFVIQCVCLASDLGSFLHPDDAFPDELMLTPRKRANFDLPVSSLLDCWQQEGSLSSELVWDLICSVLLRVLNPYQKSNNDAILRLEIIRCANKDTGIVSIRDKLRQFCVSIEHISRLVASYLAKRNMEYMEFPNGTHENKIPRTGKDGPLCKATSTITQPFLCFGNVSAFTGRLIKHSRNYNGPHVHASAISNDRFTVDEISLLIHRVQVLSTLCHRSCYYGSGATHFAREGFSRQNSFQLG